MYKLLVLVLAGFLVTSCASLNSTRIMESRKYKVFVVDKRPTRCKLIGKVKGIGTEEFEGNKDYTVPMAMTDIKRKSVYAGANVLYIENAYNSNNSYILEGLCYKCRTISRSKLRKKYRKARYITSQNYSN